MNMDATGGSGEKSDKVRKSPEIVRLTDLSRKRRYLGTFTGAWKDVCREIVRLFCESSPAARPGNPIGARILRRFIMEAVGEDDISISENNLYDWIARGKGHPDDVTFSYIDEFVRTIQISRPEYDKIRPRIIEENKARHRRNIGDMFGRQRVQNQRLLAKSKIRLEGRIFTSSPLKWDLPIMPLDRRSRTVFNQIVLFFENYDDGVYDVKAGYSEQTLENVSDASLLNRRNFVVFHGYAVPATPTDLIGHGGWLHLFRREFESIKVLQGYSCSSYEYLFDESLQTDWMGQISSPWKRNDEYGQEEKMPILPLSSVSLSESTRGKKDTNGTLSYYPFTDTIGLKSYMESLQDGYLVW